MRLLANKARAFIAGGETRHKLAEARNFKAVASCQKSALREHPHSAQQQFEGMVDMRPMSLWSAT